MAVSDPVDAGTPPGPKRVADAVEDLVPDKATVACKLEMIGKRFGSFRALQGLEPHTAVASSVEDKNLLAFSASSCTSWNEGMLSSHSSNVAV